MSFSGEHRVTLSRLLVYVVVAPFILLAGQLVVPQFTATASAGQIVSNSSLANCTGYNYGFSQTSYYGQLFVAGSTSSISRIELQFGSYETNFNNSYIGVYTNSGTSSSPAFGSLIGTLTPQTYSGSSGNFRGIYTGNVQISAGTTFWLAPKATTGNFSWCYSYYDQNRDYSATRGWGYASTPTNGTRWNSYNAGTPSYYNWAMAMKVEIGGDGLNWYQKIDNNSSTAIASSLSSTTSDYTSCGIDPTIDHAWGSGATSCMPSVTNYFTNFWTGYILSPITGTITFSDQSDDGFALNINGSRVISDMDVQGAAGTTASGSMNNSGTFSATAGTAYPIQIWHHEDGGGADVRLYWSYSGQATQIVPQDYLYSSDPTATSSDTTAPTATVTSTSIKNSSSVSVQSSEAGTAYLVKNTITVTNQASITGAADNSWNSVSISTANTNTSLSASGLSDGTYKVYAVDAAGNLSSASSGTITIDSTGPTLSSASPADNATSVYGNANVVLTFNENISRGSGNVVIYKSDGTTFETIAVSNTSLITISSSVVTINPAGTFAANTGYYVLIDSTAFTDSLANSYSGISSNSTLNFTTYLPATPSYTQPVSETKTAGQSVTWRVTPTVSDGGTLTYQWTKDGANIDGATSDSYTITSISSGSAGTYRVKISNLKNQVTQEFTSNPAILSVVGSPGAPATATLTSSGQAAGTLRLSWTVPSSNGGSAITGYEYRYSLSTEDSWSLWATTTDTYTVISNLGNAKTYKAQVRAKNLYGTSASTASANAITGGETVTALSAPTISSLTPDSSAGSRMRITLTTISGATSYQYSTDGGVSWKTFTIITDGVGATSGYVDITTPSSSSSSLVNGTSYPVTVRAVNAAGGGTASNSISAIPSKAPGVPTAVSLTLGSTGTMNLSYTAPTDNGGLALTYEYQYKLNNSSTWGSWISIGAGTSVTISGITNGNTYDARVRAKNTTGYSDSTTAVTLNTVIANGPTITRQPTNLTLTSGQTTSTSLSVSATAGEGETLSYQWYKTTQADGTRAISGATSETLTVTTSATSADAGTYKVVVTASKSGTSANVTAKIDAIGNGTLCNAPNSDTFFYASRFYAGTADTLKEFHLQFAAGTNLSVLAGTKIRFYSASGTGGRHYPDAKGALATKASTTPSDYQIAGEFSYSSIANNIAVFRGNVVLPAAGHYWWTVINTSSTQVGFCNSNPTPTTTDGWYLYKEGSSWIWFGSFRQNLDGGKFAWSTHPNYRLFTSTTTTTSSSSTTSTEVTVTVNGAPSITTSTVPGATKGSAYSTTLAATGGTAPYTWRLANGSALPAGLTLSSNGVISGTPTALEVTTSNSSSGGTLINGGFTEGFASSPTTGWFRKTTVGGATAINTVGKTLQFSYGPPACTNQANVAMSEVQQQVTIPTAGAVTFSVKVINNVWNRIGYGYSSPCYDPYEVKISRANGTSVTTGRRIPTTTTHEFAVEHTESVTITTTSANEVVTISLFGLDAGYWAGNYGPIFKEATLTTAGGASGSSSSGTTTFTVEMTDANGSKSTKVLTFNVASDITIATKSLGNANRGASYTQALTATGGSGTLRWSIASGVLPQGLTLSSSGTISGTVAETATSQTLSIAVTDSNTATVSQSYTLNVLSGVPDSPTALTAGTIGSGRVPLTWTAPVDTGGSPITSYIVAYSSGAGTANDGEVVTEDRGSVSVPASGLTFPYTLTGLKNGRSYTISVSAKNAGATSSSSNSVTVTPAAASGAPQQLSTVLANGGITVKWKKPTNSGGLKVDTYTVQCGESATVINWQNITVRQDTDENGVVSAVIDSGAMTLVKGNSYFCRVRVESGINGIRFSGDWATTTSALAFMTIPSAPVITAVDSSTVSTEIKVTFNQSTDNGGAAINSYVASVAKYKSDGSTESDKRSCAVNRSGETWTAGTKFCSITGVPLKGTFALELVAVNSVGQSEADTETVRIPGKTQILTYPNTDTNTAFTSGTRTYAKIIGDSDFPLNVRTNSGLNLAYANSDTATCTISSSGTVKVVAIGTCVITITQNGLAADGSDTDWEPITGSSETVTVTVAGATPSNPTWVSVTPGNQRLTTTWSAPQGRFSAVTGYVVEYKKTSASTWDSATVTETSTVISSLTNGDSYTVRVKAKNGTLLSQTVTMPGYFTPANVPDTPTVSSIVSYPDSSTVSITWGEVAGNGAAVLGYTVTGTSDSATAVSCSTGSSTYTCLIGGLANKNSYTFSVAARNSIGTGPSSDTQTVAIAGVAQTITLNTTPKGTGWSVGDPDTQLDASTSSGLPIQYSVVNSAICTVSSGGLVHFVKDGNCQVYLDQDGTNSSSPNGTQTKYSPATRVGSVDMVVAPAKPSAPTITSVTNSNDGLVIAWSASSSGGGTITYTITGTAAGQTDRTCSTTSLTCTISTVTKGVSYGFTALAANSIDSSTVSAAVYGTWITVPSVPNSGGTTAVSTTDGKTINAYWVKSTTTGGGINQILSYTATATNATHGSAICTVNRTSALDTSGYGCDISGLRAGAAYVVTVRALNIIGLSDTLTIGTYTPGLTQTVTLDTPTASTMTKSFGDADFQLGVSLSSGNTPTFTTSSSACTVSSTGVVHIVSAGTCVISTGHPGATNTTDSQYKSASTDITITIAGINPTAPTITRVAPGPNRLTITWLAPTSTGGNSLNYVATATNGSSFSCSPTTSTSCVITGLTDETEYTVVVTATNSVTSSLTSTSASATGTPFTNSLSPRPLVATGGNGTITFTWETPTAYDGTIAGYKIYYKPTSAGSFTTETTTARSKTLSGIAAGTRYEVYAAALVESATVVSEGNATPHGFATTNSAPGAPQSVNASSTYASLGNTDTMTVSWSAPSSNGGDAITSYLVTASAGGNSSTCTTSGTTCSIGGLSPGTAYTITVTASNGVGAGTAASASHTTVAPSSAPTLDSITATNSTGSVAISWTAPTNTGGLPIRSYIVTAYTSDGTATSYGCTSPANTLNCNISGLPYKTTLKFAVAATTLAGTGASSAFSDTVNFVLTQTITFDSMTAQAFSSGSLVLNATASSGLAVTFTSADTTICTISNGVAYFAKLGNCSITAAQSGDSRYSAATSVTQEFVINAVTPTAPTLLQVAPGSETLRATWTTSPSLGGSTLRNYIVSWAKNNDFSDEQTLTTSETTTAITGLDPETAYLVRVAVTSNDAADPSDWSNRLTAKTFGSPAAPTGVTATSPNAGSATISWTNVPDTATGGTPITGYRVVAYVQGSDVATTFVCTSSGSSCTISGLSGSTSYVFKVTAINAAGSTTSSASGSVRPGIAQTLTISDISTSHAAGTVAMSATASSGLPISYAVASESSTAATDSSWGDGRNVCRVDSSGNLTVDLAGTCVIAINQDGTNNSAATSYLPANEVTATVTVAGNVPSVVASLEATAGDGAIQVDWSAPTNDGGLPVTDYIVTWFRKGERHASLTEGGTTAVTPVAEHYGRKVIAASTLESLRERITGLTNGITYTIYVQARNSAGIGPEL